ncbi:MAG: sensor histidine kinase [Nitrospiria bacterium]
MKLSEEKTPFNLIHWFSILSFLCIALISAGSALLLSRFLTNNILQRDAEVTKAFVQSTARQENIVTYFEERNIDKTNEVFNDFFSRIATMPEVVRVYVYDVDGNVIWSDDPRLIDHNFMPNPELIQALSGKLTVSSGISGKPTKAEHVFEQEATFFAEVYIPIWNEDESEVIGVFEVYKVPLMLFNTIKRGNRLVWASAAIGGFFLYASLFWIVRRAAYVMRDQQAQLVESEKLSVVGELTSAVIHGIRNPLASMRSSAEVALETDSPSWLHQAAQEMTLEGDRLAASIRELQFYSGTSGGTYTSIPFNELLRSTLRSLEKKLKQNEINITLDLKEPTPKIDADEAQLRQVFTSLVENALEAMSKGGKLTISSLVTEENRLEIQIIDTGIGIPEDEIKNVFKPFFTSKRKGVGVGLSLAKRILEHHNGKIRLTSHLGSGTTIRIELPLSKTDVSETLATH